jgi:hypothetical protein
LITFDRQLQFVLFGKPMRTPLTICLITCWLKLFGQEVDLVRLGYAESSINSKQIGMAASPDGKYIALAYEDKTIKIFDVAAGKFVKRFSGPYNELFDLQITDDKKIVLLSKQEVQLWDWREGKHIITLPLTYEATKSALSPINSLLAVGQYEGNTAIIDLNIGKVTREILFKKHHVSALAFHPNGKTLAIGTITAFGMGAIKLFEVGTGREISQSSKDLFTSAAFNKEGTKLVAWGNHGYQILDGNDLHIIKGGVEGLSYAKNNLAYGIHLTENKVMMLTNNRAFNVGELESGKKLFTTMVEFNINNNAHSLKYGVGSMNIFPLNSLSDKVILNATKNNINQIYDSKKNAMVGYFFSDSNDDFAIISRDGRVEGTPGALAKLYWTSRKSTKKTSLESTFQKGYTPKLLSQIVNENNAQQIAFEVDNILEKIPVLALKSITAKDGIDSSSFESTQKVIKAEITIKQNPEEVTAITLYQNSKPVKTQINVGKSNYTFDISLNNSFGEANYFFVTATNKTGIDSEKVKFTVSYKGATEDKPRLFLVTIGINNYKNPKYNLNYAQADADGVSGMISQKSNSLFQQIIPFSIRNDSAVKVNIMSAFEQIQSKALEQDMLVVYYAGHGVMSEGIGRDKDFFIIPHDVTQLYGKDELLFEKAISANELKLITQQINAQKQVFILDACQSAGALEALESRTRGVAEEKAIAQLARSTGTFWITSTGSDQFASEFDKLGHGIFTYTLLEGIKGAADTNKDSKLTIRELSTYIEDKVPELSEQLKGTPQFPSAYSFGNDFPLVVYKQQN